MLSKPNRLSLKTDRVRVEQTGRTVSSSAFTAIIAPSSFGTSAVPRFAILISRKLAPLSTTRHQLKRTITEVLRHNLSQFSTGFDIILIPKRKIINLKSDEIKDDLIKLLHA